MTVHNELVAIGGTLIGERFSQVRFNRATADQGYCAGIVLDWTRRVLQSPHANMAGYLSYSRYGGETDPRHVATDQRMQIAFHNSADTYVTQTAQQKLRVVLPVLLTKPEQTDNSRFGNGVPVPRSIANEMGKIWTIGEDQFSRFDLNQDPAGRLTHSTIRHMIGQLSNSRDEQLEDNIGDGRQWGSVATVLDESARQIRSAAGRQTSKIPFANIQVVRSRPPTIYGQPDQWIRTLTTEGVQENCCTVVSLTPPNGRVGHQIAINQLKPGAFLFFDPNYGVYLFSQENLVKCFAHMFWKPLVRMPDQTTLDADRAVYCRRDVPTGSPLTPWKKVAYTVFQKRA